MKLNILRFLLIIGTMFLCLQVYGTKNKVCRGVQERYAIVGFTSSTFNWDIVDFNGTSYKSSIKVQYRNSDSIDVRWNVPLGSYIIKAQELTDFGCNSLFIADTIEIIGAIFNFSADTVYVCDRSTDTLMAPGNFGQYLWNTKEITKHKLVSEAGKYVVSANTSDGCIVEDSIWVRINPLPVVDLVGSEKVRLCGSYANTINLQVPTRLNNVKWSTGETSHTLFVSLINDKSTRHIRVSAADSSTGCVGGDTLSIYVCDPGDFAKNIPSVITPNGDGANDTWNIKELLDYDMNKKCIIEVYDRWGRIVFQSQKGYPKPWDGRMNGKLLPADAYFYILDLNNNSEPLTGTITILR